MMQRVMPELMGMRSIVTFNDEAHHCYREKPGRSVHEGKLTGDDLQEAKKNREAARLARSPVLRPSSASLASDV